jgi:hypothetical protein
MKLRQAVSMEHSLVKTKTGLCHRRRYGRPAPIIHLCWERGADAEALPRERDDRLFRGLALCVLLFVIGELIGSVFG